MEIPVIHEKTNNASNKNSIAFSVSSISSLSPLSSPRNKTVTNRNVLPSSSSSYGYSRSFSAPIKTISSRMFCQQPYEDHHDLTNLTNQGTDIDHMTFKGCQNSDDNNHMIMMSDDFTSFHGNNNINNIINNDEPQGIRSLHARLPSTDSGIQADAGFDSLSRYKGKHLLSSTNAANNMTASVAKSSDYTTTVAAFAQHQLPSSTSLASDSPIDSKYPVQNSSLSPHCNSSSGYGSDFGISSPSSASSLSSPPSSSSFPSRAISPASISSPSVTGSQSHTSASVSVKPKSNTMSLISAQPHQDGDQTESHTFHSYSVPSQMSPDDSNSFSSSQTSNIDNKIGSKVNGKPIQRQASVPAVAPKPRVSLSRKPAFLGRSGVSAKQQIYSGGGSGGEREGGIVNNKSASGHKSPSDSVTLSSGIKVLNTENGVEVRIPTKPSVPPKISQNRYNQSNSNNNNCSNNNSLKHHNQSQSNFNSEPGRVDENQRYSTTETSGSHRSSIDILSPDGSSVKIQVVKSGQPQSSLSSNTLQSSSSNLSTQAFPSPLSSFLPQSYTKVNSQNTLDAESNQAMTTATTTTATTTTAPGNLHLTRPLRIAMSNTNSSTAVNSSSISSSIITSTSTKTTAANPDTLSTTPKWRSNTSTVISSPHSYNSGTTAKAVTTTTAANHHHPHHPPPKLTDFRSVANSKFQQSSASVKNPSVVTESKQTTRHIPIEKINISTQPLPGNSSKYSNYIESNAASKNSPFLESYSKTTPISVITTSKDSGTLKNSNYSANSSSSTTKLSSNSSTSATVISSSPPAIVMSPPPPSNVQSSTSSVTSSALSSPPNNTNPHVIDSCIFRFKSPETSIFKQTFYDNNKVPPPSSSSTSSSSIQHHQQQQYQNQHLRPTYLPTPNKSDFLRKKQHPGSTSAKSPGSVNPEIIMRQTDDIFREALKFFDSREDEDWDKVFSKSNFFDDDGEDMEKLFSKYWKTEEDDEFDKIFGKIFKRRKGSLDVDLRVGVNVDEGIDDSRYGNATKTSDNQESKSCDDQKSVASKLSTGLDNNMGSRDMTSSSKNGACVNEKNDGCHGNDKIVNLTEPQRKPLSSSSAESWKETKKRMDSALSWLQHELADLRALDKQIVSQFRRCQDTIESLQAQREVWEGLEEESEFWDDMEISEFNRRCQESPGSCSLSPVSTGSRDITMATTDSMWNAVRNGGGVIQDVEATL